MDKTGIVKNGPSLSTPPYEEILRNLEKSKDCLLELDKTIFMIADAYVRIWRVGFVEWIEDGDCCGVGWDGVVVLE